LFTPMETGTSSSFSDAQKREVCAILSVGCDRLAAAKFVGCSWAEIRAAMTADRRFAADVRRAEAGAELTHMRNVQNAARDDKHWRASVWWLERRSPERYGRREANAVTPRQVERVMELLAGAVSEEVHDAADRERLLDRLLRITESLQQMLYEDDWSESRPSGHELTPTDAKPADDDSAADGYSADDWPADGDEP
jgi:hypothetical protein